MKIFLITLFISLFNLANGRLTQRPSLIPLPQAVQWKSEQFDMSNCKTFFVSDASLLSVMKNNDLLSRTNLQIRIAAPSHFQKNYIRLALETVDAPIGKDEAYILSVDKNAVILKANSAHGIFNGLQTIRQLTSNNKILGCSIKDYPAFSWRGFMIDAGRNFQPLTQIKQQIDIMSRYKLNVFHFHLTEHIAWRLQIKSYPQLTAAEYMQRNKGSFYSISEMLDLIKYCRDRNILLVPEIDMPGHSAAFTRAMGFDMQSPQGLEVVKNILREVISTYNLPYIHIGADEVVITNPNFIPEIERLVGSLGKKLIAWNPGTSNGPKTIRHLWKWEEAQKSNQAIIKIDSRTLYFSDMDPQSTVVTIFNRRFLKSAHGDENNLGAEICMWADRAVANEKDLLKQNAVYPAILAFSERSWRGKGYDGIVFHIGDLQSERARAFKEFESRLLVHKQKYFSQLPFNYVKQTHFKWKLFGPFRNNGELSKSFWPEQKPTRLAPTPGSLNATGGTVWLWATHTNFEAWLPDPQQQTTWYAYTRFWSDKSEIVNFWLDTKDQSKSGADATPPSGEWDYNKSRIWINEKIVSPPRWKYPGRKSGLLEEPLIDEMHYIRPPQKIAVRKGWNTILVKLPVNEFNPDKDWQEPPKLMFTAVPVKKSNGINWEAIEYKTSLF